MRNYNNSTASSNHEFGVLNKGVNDGSRLLNGVQEIGVLMSDSEVLTEGMKRVGELSQYDLGILLRLNDDRQKSEFLKKKLNLRIGSPVPNESNQVEIKAGLKALPNTRWALQKNGGLKLIVTEAAAIYNSCGIGELWIGLGDENHRPTGLEMQLSCLYPLLTLDKIETTVFHNVCRTWTKNDCFVNSLTYTWLKMSNHLVLKMGIHKTMKNDIALCDPKEWFLPYRSGTSLMIAKGYTLIQIYNQLNEQFKLKECNDQ